MKKFIPLFLLVLILSVSCEEKPVYYTVTFNSDGGTAVQSQIVKAGSAVSVPRDPTKDGWAFLKWVEESSSSDYDTSSPVTCNLSLKAVYARVYTVTFNSDGGSYTPSSQKVVDGGTAVEPKSPEGGENEHFSCWIYQIEGEQWGPYDFSTPVTKDITLYAHYTEEEYYAVTFDSNGGTAVKDQRVKTGETAVEPAPPAKASTYGFIGWSSDGGMTFFDFNTKITQDVALKAYYWDADVITEEQKDRIYMDMVHDVRRFYDIVRFLVSEENLMKGETSVRTAFGLKEGEWENQVFHDVFINALSSDGSTIRINGKDVYINDITSYSILIDSANEKISSNGTTTSSKADGGFTMSAYNIDIEGLKIKLRLGYDENSYGEVEVTLSLKGRVIRNPGSKECWMSVAFTIDGKEFPLFVAVSDVDEEKGNVLFFNYRGYSGRIGSVTI